MSISTYLTWQGDFVIDDQGRTILSDEDTTYIQRLIRGLLTSPRFFDKVTNEAISPPDYIFKPDYGAGLRRLVDSPTKEDEIRRLVTGVIINDIETSNRVRPVINVKVNQDGTANINIVVTREPNITIAFGVRLGM